VNIVPDIKRWRCAAAWQTRVDRFFFEPAGPVGLILCRIWIYGFLLWDSRRLDHSHWAEITPALWKPILLLSWLPGPVPSELLLAAQYALMAALALCCVGLGFRWASVAAFVLGLFVYGLPHCFGKVGHSQTLTIFTLGIFALSHAGRVGSLDAWIARWLGRPAAPAQSSEYQWPVRLMQALMATVFLAAGVAKLRQTGLAWAWSDQMQNILLGSFYIGKRPPTNLGLWIAQYPVLCQILATLTLVVELGAPAAIWSRRARWLVIPGLLGMQLGIYLAMGIPFWHYVALYFIWIEWNEIASKVARLKAPTIGRGAMPIDPALSASRRAKAKRGCTLTNGQGFDRGL
jgi:hypothetical protein